MANRDWIEGTDLGFLNEHYDMQLTEIERTDVVTLDATLRKNGASRLEFVPGFRGLARRREGVLEGLWQLPLGICLYVTVVPELTNKLPYAEVGADFNEVAGRLIDLHRTTGGCIPSPELIDVIRRAQATRKLPVFHFHGDFETSSMSTMFKFVGIDRFDSLRWNDFVDWVEGQPNIEVYCRSEKSDERSDTEFIWFVARGYWIYVRKPLDDSTDGFHALCSDAPEELCRAMEVAAKRRGMTTPSQDAIETMQEFIERPRRSQN